VKDAQSNRGRFIDHVLAFPGQEVPRGQVQPRDVTF
jgi:hypothetical protein